MSAVTNELSVTRTVTIAAPVEKVWAAITQPEHIVHWAGVEASISAVEVGGRGSWRFEAVGTLPLIIEAIDEPHSISYRWGGPESPLLDPAVSTAFTLTLEAVDGGTQLTVVETGFQNLNDPDARMQRNGAGWTQGFTRLADYLDGDS